MPGMTTPNLSQTETPLIHVFRAGTHTTTGGEKITFTEADLAASAAAYDPALHEAPIVVGHPQQDAPAYGWLQSMKLDGADLFAAGKQIDPEFAEMVRAGRFKKISMKWYRPDDAANPKPGVWYPRHIGFLGAQPPAIKGLRHVQFADKDAGVEFSEWSERTVARMFRRLHDWLIAQHGQETADKVVPPEEVEILVAEAVAPPVAVTAQAPAFAEEKQPANPEEKTTLSDKPTKEDTVTTETEKAAALAAENESLKKQLADANAKAKAAELTRRKSDAAQFCEGLIGEGKLLPAEKDTVVGLLILAGDSQPVQFGEGDGAVTDAPKARLETLLKSLPKRVEFSEVAKPGTAKKAVQFAAAPGMPVDTEALDTHAKALAYQQTHKVDYVEAVKAVQAL